MAELMELLKGQTPLVKGLFLAVGGFAGVFLVITVFFFSIILLERLFRPKNEG
jgi:hypothetical protein